LYTHVSASISSEEKQEVEWSDKLEETIGIGQQFFANDYVAVLEKVEPISSVGGFKLDQDDVAAQATIRVQGEYETYTAKPVFLIRDTSGEASVGYLPDEISDLGIRFTLTNIQPKEELFTVGISTRQKDWVIIKAMEKPFINILWLGTGLLCVGFSLAMVRRFREFSKTES
jgi:cytochrome c-type biogenesis protein CcmF